MLAATMVRTTWRSLGIPDPEREPDAAMGCLSTLSCITVSSIGSCQRLLTIAVGTALSRQRRRLGARLSLVISGSCSCDGLRHRVQTMEVRTLGSESTFCKGTIGAKPRLYATSCGRNHV